MISREAMEFIVNSLNRLSGETRQAFETIEKMQNEIDNLKSDMKLLEKEIFNAKQS